MRALRTAVALVLALALPAPVLAADLQAGLDAYERGDYATALEELRPLAEPKTLPLKACPMFATVTLSKSAQSQFACKA